LQAAVFGRFARLCTAGSDTRGCRDTFAAAASILKQTRLRFDRGAIADAGLLEAGRRFLDFGDTLTQFDAHCRVDCWSFCIR